MKPFVVVAEVEAQQQQLVQAASEVQQQLAEAEAPPKESVNRTGNVHFAIGDLIEIKAPVLVPWPTIIGAVTIIIQTDPIDN